MTGNGVMNIGFLLLEKNVFVHGRRVSNEETCSSMRMFLLTWSSVLQSECIVSR